MREFYYHHVVYVDDRGKTRLRGRYFLFLAAVIWVGGTVWIARGLPGL